MTVTLLARKLSCPGAQECLECHSHSRAVGVLSGESQSWRLPPCSWGTGSSGASLGSQEWGEERFKEVSLLRTRTVPFHPFF